MVAWNEITRVCWRICVLRERGRHDEAEQMRSETLASLVTAARKPTDTEEEIARRLEALMAREAERVADAAVLAELLQSLLPEASPVSTPPPRVTPAAVRPQVFAAESAGPRATSVSIADFIDTMLQQDDSAGSASPASRRRAP